MLKPMTEEEYKVAFAARILMMMSCSKRRSNIIQAEHCRRQWYRAEAGMEIGSGRQKEETEEIKKKSIIKAESCRRQHPDGAKTTGRECCTEFQKEKPEVAKERDINVEGQYVDGATTTEKESGSKEEDIVEAERCGRQYCDDTMPADMESCSGRQKEKTELINEEDERQSSTVSPRPRKKKKAAPGAAMESVKHPCRICGAEFKSHQALGGHMSAGHNKQRIKNEKMKGVVKAEAGAEAQDKEVAEAGTSSTERLHRCNECPMVFRTGQELGGHKRKHYNGPSLHPPKKMISSSSGSNGGSVTAELVGKGCTATAAEELGVIGGSAAASEELGNVNAAATSTVTVHSFNLNEPAEVEERPM